MKVMANALWLSCCRIAADGLSFVLFLAIARTLGPTGTGQYSYAFAIAGLVALVSTSGLEEYGIRQYARAAPGERAQLWASMLVTQGVQLALGLTAFALFLGLETTRLAGVVVMLELAAYVVGWGIARTLFVPAMASQSMAAPAASELPSITPASSSCCASEVNTAPWPALNSGLSSSQTTVAITASSALPPLASTACPAVSADRNASR